MASGYGSAGAGNRTLRQKSTAVGVASNRAVERLKKQLYDAALNDPSPSEIRRSIRTQQCPFCLDPRTFQALSQHWLKGHGINLQDIRDYIQVPKSQPFISNELKAVFSKHSRKRYDPNKLKSKGGPHRLSIYGVAAQRRKAEKAWQVQIDRGHRKIPRKCQVCSGTFYNPHGLKVKTCGNATCVFEIKSRAFKGRKAPWAKPPHKAPKAVRCSWCAEQFVPRVVFGNSNRRTCSNECQRNKMSASAKSRTDHWIYLKKRQAEVLAQRRPRYCETPGCGRRYVARGLCGKHYQRRVAHGKVPMKLEA